MRTTRFVFLSLIALAGCEDSSTNKVAYTPVTDAAHDCAKRANVSIDTNGGTFKLTSTCENVLVKGSGNKVTVEAAKRIDIDGDKNVVDVGAADTIRAKGAGNTISYKKGLTKKAADVVTTGDGSSIIQSH
jgi:hypothetical protein